MLALIVQSGPVLELDLRRRVLVPDTGIDVGPIDVGAIMAISPTGTHAAITRLRATDVAPAR